MKQKVSISIDQETIEKMEMMVKDKRFRNRSHLVEFSIQQVLEGKGGRDEQ